MVITSTTMGWAGHDAGLWPVLLAGAIPAVLVPIAIHPIGANGPHDGRRNVHAHGKEKAAGKPAAE